MIGFLNFQIWTSKIQYRSGFISVSGAVQIQCENEDENMLPVQILDI